MDSDRSIVMAFAGRRVDAPGAEVRRFPAEMEGVAAALIRRELEESDARMLVSSAACGADLLAIEAATSLGIRRRIVIPFSRAAFRVRSVSDRPGNWGERYDRAMDAAEARGDVVYLGLAESDRGAYLAANEAILDEAQALGSAEACALWDGVVRGPGDATAAFQESARARGIRVREIICAPGSDAVDSSDGRTLW